MSLPIFEVQLRQALNQLDDQLAAITALPLGNLDPAAIAAKEHVLRSSAVHIRELWKEIEGLLTPGDFYQRKT